jgi:hypothetical protein
LQLHDDRAKAIAIAGGVIVLIALVCVKVWTLRVDDSMSVQSSSAAPPAVVYVERGSEASAPTSPVQFSDPGGFLQHLHEIRPGPPPAFEEIGRLQEEHRQSFLQAHPRPQVPPIPSAPHVGPPDVQEILDQIHSHYPVDSSPTTHPASSEHVTYGPTHFEYRVDYDPADQPHSSP